MCDVVAFFVYTVAPKRFITSTKTLPLTSCLNVMLISPFAGFGNIVTSSEGAISLWLLPKKMLLLLNFNTYATALGPPNTFHPDGAKK